MRPRTSLFAICLLLPSSIQAQDDPPWALERGLTSYAFHHKGKPVAHYRWKDADTRRSFFYHLSDPGGLQVTRNHPPVPGRDATDHDTMHPGLWMSFGDLNGQDYWRNKARVWKESEALIKDGPFTFAEHLVLMDKDETGEEGQHQNSFQFFEKPEAFLIVWTAKFVAKDKDLVFGDQEEMGLGVRLHTDLTVKAGGTIRDSEGRTNEKGVWGKTAKWCGYFRAFKTDKETVHRGVALFPDPANFRPCWWHVRDYGLMVANPFGQNAFTRGEKSRVTVKKGDILTLRFGILLFAQTGAEPRIAAAYDDFLKTIK